MQLAAPKQKLNDLEVSEVQGRWRVRLPAPKSRISGFRHALITTSRPRLAHHASMTTLAADRKELPESPTARGGSLDDATGGQKRGGVWVAIPRADVPAWAP